MKRRGFTIVELLIVIVVIAILAAISVVAYTGIQNRAHEATVRSDLSNFQKQMEVFRAIEGRYPRTNAEFPDFRITRSSYDETRNNVYYVVNLPEDRYAFGVRSKPGTQYMLTNTGLQEDVPIHGLATAQAAGFEAWADATTPNGWRAQGLIVSGGVGTWQSWRLVQ